MKLLIDVTAKRSKRSSMALYCNQRSVQWAGVFDDNQMLTAAR